MSNDRSEGIDAARSSNILSLLENAEAGRAAVEQNLRTPQRNSNQLSEEILSAQNELSALKVRQNRALDELRTCKAATNSLQAHCEQFVKANEGISTRITDLSTKIFEDRRSRLEKITSAEQYFSGVHAALEKIVWTPEALQRLAEALQMQVPELEKHSADLDSGLQRKRTKLDHLQAQSTNNSMAGDVTFPAEEQQAMLQIFRDEFSKLQSMLRHLTSQKELLKEEVDRLSRLDS
uniref:Uncharacterized protein n=1 Tax=Rhipicephalus zambeziensis TaxID=60191 RepID=A0A224YIZ4_9ACAR